METSYPESQPKRLSRLIKTFQLNSKQLQFGSYAAELSFYIIWAVVPILLAFANVAAILPINQEEIVGVLGMAFPDEVGKVLIPIITSYLENTSAGALSLGLLISLWPASNVFNTVQRVLNTIYKAKPRSNIMLQRLFGYIFTLMIAIVAGALSIIIIFGEHVLEFIEEWWHLDLSLILGFLQQSWIIAVLGLFILLVLMYAFMPNVKWPLKYAVPGAVFAMLGFALISQLFSLYLSFTSSQVNSNSAIGVLIVVLIWLYFNCMVIAIGGYVNVFYHDYKTKTYAELLDISLEFKTWQKQSEHFMPSLVTEQHLKGRVYKQKARKLKEEDQVHECE